MRNQLFFKSLLLLFFVNVFMPYARASVPVELSPITFTSDDIDDRMNQIYAMCDSKKIDLDSTVQFVLDGCDAPILVSMDAMRSGSNPFDPSEVGSDEIFVKGPPYLANFDSEGMYVIFCDDSFKSVATCITMVENLGALSPSPTAVPTVGEWGLLILSLSLCIIGLTYLKTSEYVLASV